METWTLTLTEVGTAGYVSLTLRCCIVAVRNGVRGGGMLLYGTFIVYLHLASFWDFFPPMSIFHSLHGCKMLQNTPVVFHSTDRLIAIHIKRGTSSAFVRTQPNIIVMHILDDDVVDILLPCSK